MASLGAPVLSVSGTVRRVSDETIPGRPAERVEGRSYPAREEYTLRHVLVDTGLGGVDPDGGVADVTFAPDSDISGAQDLAVGDRVELHVRPYLAWVNGGSARAMRVSAYGLAAVVVAPSRALASA